MKVSIIGTGYVGLVTGLVFAKHGNEVLCIDTNQAVIDATTAGETIIYEEGLESLLKEMISKKNFEVAKPNIGRLSKSEIIFVCVDTPFTDNGFDYQQIESALSTCGRAIKESTNRITVVVKSTVLPGTTNNLVKEKLEIVSNKRVGKDFGIAVNPEFLREGNALLDFIEADRIVIGSDDEESIEVLQELYQPWSCPKVILNPETAEFTKYYSNTLLSLLISFTNEMANIAQSNPNIDYRKVIETIQLDKRLSPINSNGDRIKPEILSYLVPGPGFGGSCLPKDINTLIELSDKNGVQTPILDAVVSTNEVQPQRIISLIDEKIAASKGKRYLILGVSHKPNTDDIRASVAIEIIEKLSVDRKLKVHDPQVFKNRKNLFAGNGNIEVVSNWETEVADTDIIILLTGWDEYQKIASYHNHGELRNKIVVDTRYFFKNLPKEVKLITL